MTDEAQTQDDSPEEVAFTNVGRIVEQLRAQEEARAEKAKATLSPEIRVKRLIELQQRHADRHARECPFNPGDLIVPMPNTMYPQDGACIVLEVLPRELVTPVTFEPVGSIGFGMQPDLRIAAIPAGETPLVYWVESWMWDRFVEKTS